MQSYDKKLADTMRSEHRCSERIKKADVEKRFLSDRRIPNGMELHALPFVCKQYDVAVPLEHQVVESAIRDDGKLSSTIPADQTSEEARECIHFH